MSLADEIPTTVFVGQVPANKADLETWMQHLSSYVNGNQAVKVKQIMNGTEVIGSVKSLRNGAMVFVQGSLTTVSGTTITVELLPVAPLEDTFLVGNSNNAPLMLNLVKEQRTSSFTATGTTLQFSGWYLGANTNKIPRVG